MSLQVTEKARLRIAGILKQYRGQVFRVAVEAGGCAGIKYQFSLSEKEETDICFEGVDYIVTDPISVEFIDGSTLDLNKDPFNQVFFLENPNAKNTCGCGESIGV